MSGKADPEEVAGALLGETARAEKRRVGWMALADEDDPREIVKYPTRRDLCDDAQHTWCLRNGWCSNYGFCLTDRGHIGRCKRYVLRTLATLVEIGPAAKVTERDDWDDWGDDEKKAEF